jgi:hypothetical protein
MAFILARPPGAAHAAATFRRRDDCVAWLVESIDQKRRAAFLVAVAAELEAGGQAGAVGIGSVHRVARTVQRRFFDPPQLPNVSPVHRGSAA